MKKILTLCAAVLLAAGAFAQSYGIAVNGATYYAGTENPNPLDPSFKEFMVLGLGLNAGDQLQLWDPSGNGGNGAGWTVVLDGASTEKIRLDGNHYVCDQEGCFDFYIKLKYEQDQLYVGEGDCKSPEGTTIGGGTTPPVDVPDSYWYYKGWIDGGDLQNEEGGFNIFQGGTASLVVEENAYLFVMYQEKGKQGVQYMAAEYVDGPTHATMLTSGSEKLHVGPGSWTLYLYDNGDGTVELSTEPLEKPLIGGGEQAIDNTNVTEKAHKAIIDGQLRIIRGDKMFDATGRQL